MCDFATPTAWALKVHKKIDHANANIKGETLE